MIYPGFDYEEEFLVRGFVPFGVDEVGVGCLAYDVTVAAVVVPDNAVSQLKGKVTDSKKLTKKRREELAIIIHDTCECAIFTVDNTIIDEINILEAIKLGIYGVARKLNYGDFALIDGDMLINNLGISYRNIVKGDSLCMSIACASIIAKVDRDARMRALSKIYPMYGFDTHVGYATKKHIEAIKKYGPCEIHRKSFNRVREYC